MRCGGGRRLFRCRRVGARLAGVCCRCTGRLCLRLAALVSAVSSTCGVLNTWPFASFAGAARRSKRHEFAGQRAFWLIMMQFHRLVSSPLQVICMRLRIDCNQILVLMPWQRRNSRSATIHTQVLEWRTNRQPCCEIPFARRALICLHRFVLAGDVGLLALFRQTCETRRCRAFPASTRCRSKTLVRRFAA